MPALAATATAGAFLNAHEVGALVAQAFPAKDYKDGKVLVIIPDGTRSCPLGMVWAALHEQIGPATSQLDIMIALGTHPPMSEEAICQRLEITAQERAEKYGRVRFYNHEWD